MELPCDSTMGICQPDVITETIQALNGTASGSFLPLSADFLFYLQHILWISWITLIVDPFPRLSQYVIFGPTLLVCTSYLAMFLQSIFYPLAGNFYTLSGIMEMAKDRYFITSCISHFGVCDLWVGYWMAKDFWRHYVAGYDPERLTNWPMGRIVFTVILLMTKATAPIGFLFYNLMTYTVWARKRTATRIDVHNTINEPERIPKNNFLLDYRWAHVGDGWPTPLAKIYRAITGVIGFAIFFTIALPAQFWMGVYCLLTFRDGNLPNVWQYDASKPDPFAFKFWFWNWIKLPQLLRRIVYTVRFQQSVLRVSIITKPHSQYNIFDWFKYWLFETYTMLEYVPYSEEPFPLFNSYQVFWEAKTGQRHFFPFGDGVGVSSHEYVSKYLQNNPRKDREIIGWPVSDTQLNFCPTAILYRSTEDPVLTIGRDLIKTWIKDFWRTDKLEDPTIKWRVIPRVPNQHLVQTDIIYQAIGEAMFYLITAGGEMSKKERVAYLDAVHNTPAFLPNWFGFMLGGGKGRRTSYEGLLTHRRALARYTDAPSWKSALTRLQEKRAAREKKPRQQWDDQDIALDTFTDQEMLRLFTIVFNVAAGVAPGKLTVAVVNRLWVKDVEERRRVNLMFQKDPIKFIRETARLDKLVPMVNVVATEDMRKEISQVLGMNIPSDTQVHCSLVTGNHDPAVFKNPYDFNPYRDELDELLSWSAVDGNWADVSKAPRVCPGRTFALHVIQFVASRFAPVLDAADNVNSFGLIPAVKSGKEEEQSDNNNPNPSQLTGFQPVTEIESAAFRAYLDNKAAPGVFASKEDVYAQHHKCMAKGLDWYTTLVMKLKDLAVFQWNTTPPRGMDIDFPIDRPTRELSFGLPQCAPNPIPGWDEDEPQGDTPFRLFARKLVNADLWSIVDLPKRFDSKAEAITYRWNLFSAIPQPNVVYEELTSDAAMSRLAFFGLPAHRTRRTSTAYGIPDRNAIKDHQVMFVNDSTGLSSFKVRPGFEKYGAAAYFDKNFEIVGIYWSHAEKMVLKPKHGEPNTEWEHVKYVWKSSFFAEVTIVDHLLVTHMIESNALVSASRSQLSPNHPLRIFLKPFTYHTISINNQAISSLMNPRGLVHRSWAFEYDEFVEVCKYVALSYKFTLLTDKIHKSMQWKHCQHWNGVKLTDSQGVPNPTIPSKLSEDEWAKNYPIDQDLNRFWNVVHRYVEKFMDDNFPEVVEANGVRDKLPSSDTESGEEILLFIADLCKQLGIPGCSSRKAFIDILTHLICVGSGWHEHVGQVSDYVMDPDFIGLKLEPGLERMTVQTYSQLLSLTVVTGLEMPGILEDWSHLIPDDVNHAKNLDNYNIFKADLLRLMKKIDDANMDPTKRRYPFQSFNPRNIETSVSI